MPAVDPKAAVEALRRRYEESVIARSKTASSHALEDAASKEKQHAAAVATAKESEQKQDYLGAAASWARAFELGPSAEIANRAALCFRRVGTDLHRAAKFGEEALKLEPNKAAYRVTLAMIYADAGLLLRARGELERAQALDPQSTVVKEALARLKTSK
jgi:tetratricopeptide (TPR) repeat protein